MQLIQREQKMPFLLDNIQCGWSTVYISVSFCVPAGKHESPGTALIPRVCPGALVDIWGYSQGVT